MIPPYPDIGILTDDELSKHETKVNLLKSAWEPNAYMIHLLHTTIPLVFTTGDPIIFHCIRIHSQENMRQYPYRHFKTAAYK
jgi:hypothetical protein